MSEPKPDHHYVVREPKFCRCRVCHEHFYGETVSEARAACQAHVKEQHPDWGETGCYCPD
jgi:hypothetical protein